MCIHIYIYIRLPHEMGLERRVTLFSFLKRFPHPPQILTSAPLSDPPNLPSNHQFGHPSTFTSLLHINTLIVYLLLNM